jgi:hypothetical protein
MGWIWINIFWSCEWKVTNVFLKQYPISKDRSILVMKLNQLSWSKIYWNSFSQKKKYLCHENRVMFSLFNFSFQIQISLLNKMDLRSPIWTSNHIYIDNTNNFWFDSSFFFNLQSFFISMNFNFFNNSNGFSCFQTI